MTKKFRLFPQDQGWSPLIWMSFLLIPVVSLYPYDSFEKIISIGLILAFAICYRNSLFEGKYDLLWLLLQYGISCCYFAWLGYIYLYMFPAWLIGFSDLSRKRFGSYYGLLVVFMLLGGLGNLAANGFHGDEVRMTVIFGVFTLGAPFGGRDFYKQQQQRKQLYQANQRLEKIVVGEERNRIARELHDSLGHSLSVLAVKADLAQKLQGRDEAAVLQELSDIQQLSRGTLTTVREIVSDMRRKTILEELVEINRALSAAKIIFTTVNEESTQGLPQQVQNEIGYCLREAATNIIRHSQASYCQLVFQKSAADLLITVHDNGIGTAKVCAGNGLQGMRERVESLQGYLLISDDQGLKLTIKVPVTAEVE